MEFVRLNNVENKYWNEAWDIYISSFPVFEKRRIEDQIEAMKNDKYHCYTVIEKEYVVGIIFYWKWDNYKYIEHLAINKNLRGKNYGSKILKEFCSDGKTIVLEIDMPIDEVSKNRLRFYEKLDFKLNKYKHIHPPYRRGYKGHELKVLSYNSNLLDEEYNKFNDFLVKDIMKYSEYTVSF